MGFQIARAHFVRLQSPHKSDMILHPAFPDPVEQEFAVPREFDLILDAVVCRDDIPRHIDDRLLKLLHKLRQDVEHVVQSLDRIISLAQKYGVPLDLVDLPLPVIEIRPQRLVHKMVLCIGRVHLRHLPVKVCPPGDMTDQRERLLLVCTALCKLRLLVKQSVLL